MIYEWPEGRSRGVSAQLVGETIEYIRDRDGVVCSPGALVEEARPINSPIHGLFTWNEHQNSERWLRHEARKVIGSIAIRFVEDPTAELRPAFVHIRREQPNGNVTRVHEGYVSIAQIRADTDMRDQAIRECLQQLRGLQRRYDTLVELKAVWEAVDEAAGRLG